MEKEFKASLVKGVNASVPIAVVNGEDIPQEIETPILAMVASAGIDPVEVYVYTWNQLQIGPTPGGGAPPPGHALLSMRAWNLVAGPDTVVVTFPTVHWLGMRIPRVEDIPKTGSVFVAEQLSDSLQGWALVTVAGHCYPLRLEGRADLDTDAMRVPMVIRTLWEAHGRDKKLQVAALPRLSLRQRLSDPLRVGGGGPQAVRRTRSLRSAVVMISRLMSYAVDMLLQVLLGAPSALMRTTPSHAGDDSGRVVRLHPSMFALLGIEPNSQVVASWGPRQTVAVAIPDHLPHGSADPSVERAVRGTVRTGSDLDPAFPSHLVARVSAQVRLSLGAPPDTVVSIRRRMGPVVGHHLNRLLIPLAAVVVAAAAVPDAPWLLWLILLMVAVFMAMVSLRIPRPPKGPWP